MRLIVPDAGGKLFHIPGADIGGIGDDQIEFSQKRADRLSGIYLDTAHPTGELIECRIFLGYGQGVQAYVRQGHSGILHPAGDCQTDAAAAAAQIQNPGILVKEQALPDGKLCQGAGIVSGNQHLGRDQHGKAVEFPLTQHIGNGLVRQKTPKIFFHLRHDLFPGI